MKQTIRRLAGFATIAGFGITILYLPDPSLKWFAAGSTCMLFCSSLLFEFAYSKKERASLDEIREKDKEIAGLMDAIRRQTEEIAQLADPELKIIRREHEREMLRIQREGAERISKQNDLVRASQGKALAELRDRFVRETPSN